MKNDKNDKNDKSLKRRIKNKLTSIWKYLRANVLTKDMILWVIIAELIFWSPVIVTSILALLINPWYWTVTSAIMLFWAGPFTPAVPLQIALALALKGIYNKIRRKKDESGTRQLHIRNDNADVSTIETEQGTRGTDGEITTTISKK